MFNSRFSRVSPQKIKTSNLLPTASLCKKLIVDSTFLDHASGTIKLTEQLLSSGTHLHSFVLSTYSVALFDSLCSPILNTFYFLKKK